MSGKGGESANVPGEDRSLGTDPTELERHLHDQIRVNAELDAEVRYLQAELAIRNEFVADLEEQLERVHLHAGTLLAVVAEYSAYRSRAAHRIVDGVIVRVQRVPWLYRPARGMARTALRTRRPAGLEADDDRA